MLYNDLLSGDSSAARRVLCIALDPSDFAYRFFNRDRCLRPFSSWRIPPLFIVVLLPFTYTRSGPTFWFRVSQVTTFVFAFLENFTLSTGQTRCKRLYSLKRFFNSRIHNRIVGFSLRVRRTKMNDLIRIWRNSYLCMFFFWFFFFYSKDNLQSIYDYYNKQIWYLRNKIKMTQVTCRGVDPLVTSFLLI